MFFLISFIFSRVEEISMFLLLILKVLNVTNKGKKEEANTECNGSETFSAVFCEHQHLQNFSLMSACISSIARIAQQPHNNFHNLQQGTGFILKESYSHGIMGRRFPDGGVAEIQKMSPSTAGRCYCCH